LITNDLGFDAQLTPVVFGGVLILLMFVAPGGAVGLFQRARTAVLHRMGRAPTTVSAADAAFASSEHVAEEVAAETDNEMAGVSGGPDIPDDVPNRGTERGS
jgi:hypothetical protein